MTGLPLGGVIARAATVVTRWPSCSGLRATSWPCHVRAGSRMSAGHSRTTASTLADDVVRLIAALIERSASPLTYSER
ncbi:hypothetical protein AB0B25_20500 [Nocardia sp. NPDC049190]|uniref:hypothetical protein n=1 Tax=Nocardia sp. NPDC049190 TaxID=3155650 RepID=UPI0033E60A24